MEYNTQRNPLMIKEYGRNVQKLVEYAVTIKKKEKRNEVAQAIIKLMEQMNPHLKNVEEFRHKLWDHLIYISDFQLKIDSPYTPLSKETYQAKPKRLPYPHKKIALKHYGKNVEYLVEKALSLKDEKKQHGFIESIGSYMKLVYRNRNRDNTSDEVIKSDLEILSGGKFKLDKEFNFDLLTRSVKRRPPRNSNRESPYKRKGRRSSH